jgi:hypothetical protein
MANVDSSLKSATCTQTNDHQCGQLVEISHLYPNKQGGGGLCEGAEGC